MLNYNHTIKEEKSYQGLQINEVKPVMKLIIRGKKREFLSAIGKSLNLLLPNEANTSSRSEKLTALWLSPDEWMIYSNEALSSENNNYETENLLNENISKKNLGAVIDVTDQFVQLELRGKDIYKIFSAGCPFNFNEFKEKKGSTTQTVLNHMDVILHHKDENIVNLFVRRSFSEHLYAWIEDCCAKL